MTKEELEKYRKKKLRIEKLQEEIKALYEKDVPAVNGKVSASSKDFPYTPYRISVLISEPKENDKIMYRIRKCQREVSELVEYTDMVESFIDGIEDPELKTIFELRYLYGNKLPKIAEEVGLDRSTIGKRITSYLKLSPLSPF
nr:MAG TPA: Protein of unknown function (DUF722) [Caudoviricetes sp.]